MTIGRNPAARAPPQRRRPQPLHRGVGAANAGVPRRRLGALRTLPLGGVQSQQNLGEVPAPMQDVLFVLQLEDHGAVWLLEKSTGHGEFKEHRGPHLRLQGETTGCTSGTKIC